MAISRTSVKLVQVVVFVTVMYFALQLALYWGVETKPWLQRSWEFVTGGALGAIAGFAFFVLVGTIGWVSGPVFGAVGLLGLMGGGVLGGMGLGAVVHIVRDPDNYNFNVSAIALTILIGLVLARALSSLVGRKLTASMEAQSPVP